MSVEVGRKYSEREIADAYTRFRMAVKGQQVNVVEYVLALDYDALAATCIEHAKRADVAESRIATLAAESAELARCLDGGVNCAQERIVANARIAALEAELRRIAAPHIVDTARFPNGHIYCKDCDACHRPEIASAALNSSASETDTNDRR